MLLKCNDARQNVNYLWPEFMYPSKLVWSESFAAGQLHIGTGRNRDCLARHLFCKRARQSFLSISE